MLSADVVSGTFCQPEPKPGPSWHLVVSRDLTACGQRPSGEWWTTGIMQRWKVCLDCAPSLVAADTCVRCRRRARRPGLAVCDDCATEAVARMRYYQEPHFSINQRVRAMLEDEDRR